ncbi:hypothetical protein PLESTF_000614800 [Pleodorina starrii]|nr:hypothetical protein PLESTF_000614800 [Pleodorina starrii]
MSNEYVCDATPTADSTGVTSGIAHLALEDSVDPCSALDLSPEVTERRTLVYSSEAAPAAALVDGTSAPVTAAAVTKAPGGNARAPLSGNATAPLHSAILDDDDTSFVSRLLSRTTMKPSVMLGGPMTVGVFHGSEYFNWETIQPWYETGFVWPPVAAGLLGVLCSVHSDAKVFDGVVQMVQLDKPFATPSAAAKYLDKSPMAELLWPLYPAACQSWPLGMLLPVPKTQFLSDVTFRCYTCTSSKLLRDECAAVMFMVALDEFHHNVRQGRPLYLLDARGLCKACIHDIDDARLHHEGKVPLWMLVPRRKFYITVTP